MMWRGNWLVIKQEGFRMEGKGRARPGRKGRLNTEVFRGNRKGNEKIWEEKEERQYHEKHVKKMDILIQVEFLKVQSLSSLVC